MMDQPKVDRSVWTPIHALLMPRMTKVVQSLSARYEVTYEEALRMPFMGSFKTDSLAEYRIEDSRRKGGSVLTGAWVDAIYNDGVTFDDIYSTKHKVTVPIDVNMPDNPVLGIIAAYNLLGIPVDESLDWLKIRGIKSAPHFVRRYKGIASAHGLEFGPTQYQILFEGLRLHNLIPEANDYGHPESVGKVPVKYMNHWARVAKALKDAGVDYLSILDLGSWIGDDWNWEAIKNLVSVNVSHVEAAHLWNSGLKDSSLIVKHYKEGIPLEWLKAMYTAQKESENQD